MKLTYLFFVAFLYIYLPLNAKKVVIQGNASSFSGEEISISRYRDYLTLDKKNAGRTIIDEEQHFQLSFESENVEYINIRIGDKEAYMYTEPGKVYNIHLSYQPGLNANKLYDKSLSLKFSYPAAGELNQLVGKFISAYADFLIKNEKLLITNQRLQAIEKFEKQVREEFGEIQHPYFRYYLQYNMASLKDGLMGSKKEIFEKNIANQPVAVNNYEYMSLFRQFYQGQFAALALGKKGSEILGAINNSQDINKLMTLVAVNQYLTKNDTLRELFIINGLMENYHNKALFDKNKIIATLSAISKSGRLKNIAGNAVEQLTYLQPGSTAPDFQLTDRNGNIQSRENLSGKPVYLHFWSTQSAPSMREMVVLSEFHGKYPGKLNIVSVNLDADEKAMNNALKGKNYGWILCHYGSDRDIREKYRVRTLPTYVLIDQKGKIVQYPAEKPTDGIEKSIYKLISGK